MRANHVLGVIPQPRLPRGVLVSLLLLLSVPTPPIGLAQLPNNALDFTGSSYVEGLTLNVNLPQGDEPRTLEAWIRPHSAQNGTVVNYGAFATNQRFGLLIIDQRLYLVGEFHDVQGSTLIPIGEWTHVAIAYDGSGTTPRLYVNGVLERTTPLFSTGAFETTGGNWRIGTGSGIDSLREPFDGAIDEVKVWDHSRTAVQIQLDMIAEGCSDPGLVAYYDFNQGIAGGDNRSIETILDRSDSGSDGVVVGFALTGDRSNFVPGAPVCTAAENHGRYVACVAETSASLPEHGSIVSAAARSSCGKRAGGSR